MAKFRPGDRVRVAKPEYGTYDQIGTVTEPDEFWTFGPCVILDGQEHAGAYLDDDLEVFDDSSKEGGWATEPEFEPPLEHLASPDDAETWHADSEPRSWYMPDKASAPSAAPVMATDPAPQSRPPDPTPSWPTEPPARALAVAEEPRREIAAVPARDVSLAAVPAETDDQRAHREWELYQRGMRDGWAEAVRHVAYRARVEGGALADAGTIPPELNGLIAGMLARIESAEARALMAEAQAERRQERAVVLPPQPEPERQGLSAQTLTTLIQAVSEIVIQERERAKLQWQARLDMAESRAEAERARRMAIESEAADLRRRAEPPQLPGVLQEGTLMEVLSCAEEFISGARLNRALVLHALRETLSQLRQVSAYDALRAAANPPRAIAADRR